MSVLYKVIYRFNVFLLNGMTFGRNRKIYPKCMFNQKGFQIVKKKIEKEEKMEGLRLPDFELILSNGNNIWFMTLNKTYTRPME